MGYKILLFATLSVLWLTLSGYFDKPLLLSLGLVSVIVSLAIAWRMRILDNESVPYMRIFGLLPYWCWLSVEVVRSSLAISAVILRPDMVLTPRLIRIKTLPSTTFGRTLFANSITLTPGTVSIDLDDDEIIVHTLIKQMTAREGFAEMARRCAKAAGEKDISF